MKIDIAPPPDGLTALAVAMYSAHYYDAWLASVAAQSIADEWRRPIAVVPFDDRYALYDLSTDTTGRVERDAVNVVEPTPRPIADVDTGGAL